MCRGRIEGSHPVFIPLYSLLAEKLILQANKNFLHGGVVLIMTTVRSNYWIPILRKLTKSVRICNGCKRFNSLSYPELNQTYYEMIEQYKQCHSK